MNIYDFIQMINDTENVVFKIFDCNTENCVFVSDDEDETGVEFTADMLLDSKYADLEFYSIDMWTHEGTIYIEFNVDIDEEEDEDFINAYLGPAFEEEYCDFHKKEELTN